ncbi:MAG: N-acetylmuramoyl-L-alanine amidase, partial [Coriobacteriia bacterium]|nr:N-acetylmuramoyl-L-alanine amidase [Coriobacteriia bacterium]
MSSRAKTAVLTGAVVLFALIAVAGVFLLRGAEQTGPLVVIDAGHGGGTSGVGVDGVREEEFNLAIAKKLRSELTRRGYRVIMTRTTDSRVATATIPTWRWVGLKKRLWAFGVNTSLNERAAASHSDLQSRVDIANAANADVFVSVHNNASRKPEIRGTQTFAARGDKAGRALAASIQDGVVARTSSENHGAGGSGFYVCRWTNMPAVLVECGYFTNAEDVAALKSPRYQARVAEGIADGIDRWRISYPLTAKEPQIAAENPVALAAAVSAKAHPDGGGVAVVMPADQPALGPPASALAALLGAPLLLSERATLPT